MNNLDKQYQTLLQDILDNGVEKKDRTGTGTISVFGRQIRHNMKDGFPLLTTKKMAWKTMVTELLWFLRGDTNIKYLIDNDCHIWDGDAYKHYLEWIGPRFQPLNKEEFINKIKTDNEFAKKWGELGPIYGRQWRGWNGKRKLTEEDNTNFEKWRQNLDRKGIDQIQNLINDLKTNPDSRRLMVNAWNVGELDQMVLPPCHYGFQVYTRELSSDEYVNLMVKKHGVILEGGDDTLPKRAISLMWNQRSVDTFLGLPFNIASYGLLLEIIAKEVNMVPDELIGNLGDVHLYSNHVEQAKEQIGRKLTIDERMDWWFENKKPNRDVCDRVNDQSPYGKGVYFDSVGVPKTTREPFELPKLNILHNPCKDIEVEGKTADISCYNIFDFVLENYQSHPAIKAPLSN
jgi:thymidylate synthase